MGVLYDYFRSSSDTAAVSLMDDLGGGPVATAGDGVVDAVDLKGIDPTVILGQLVALVRGVRWDAGLVATELLWSGDEQEGPWLMSIGDAARDTLASIASADAPNLAEQWGQTEELAWNGPLPGQHLLPIIDQVAGLAGRARDAGDHLYCWCSL
jgi:hypothetical protein